MTTGNCRAVFERDRSIIAIPGQVVDLGDHTPAQEIIRGSGPEQLFVKGDLLFVAQLQGGGDLRLYSRRSAGDCPLWHTRSFAAQRGRGIETRGPQLRLRRL
jgi:hypothetical protein